MYPRTSEIFEFNKMLFIYVVTVLITALWLIKQIKNGALRLSTHWFVFFLTGFFISQTLSTVFSIDVHTSVFGYYGRFNGGLLSLSAYLLLFYVFLSNFHQDKNIALKIERLLKISLVSCVFTILWAIPGKFGHDLSCWLFMGRFDNGCWTNQFDPAARVFSTLGQPNWMGAYLAINLFIGLHFLIKNLEKKGQLLLYGFFLVADFTFILFTRSRSALLAAVIGMALFLFGYFLIERKVHRKLILLAVMIILSVPVFIFKTGSPSVDRYLSGQFLMLQQQKNIPAKTGPLPKPQSNVYDLNDNVTESLDIRKIVWKGAWELGKKYPLFGTGVETFAYAYYFVRPAAHNLTSEWDYLYNKAHNEYLNYLATTGFLGLIAYLSVIAAVFLLAIRQILQEKDRLRKIQTLALLAAYLSILITNFFGFSTSTVNLYYYLIPALIITAANPAAVRIYQIKSVHLRLLSSLMVVFAGVFLIFASLRYFLADVQYAQSEAAVKENQYDTAASLLVRALGLHYEHVYQDKLSYTLANLAFLAAYQKQTETAQKLMKLSDQYNLQSINASPKNLLYQKTRAKNYYLFYQVTLNKSDLDEAVKALKKAVVLSPTDPKLHYSLAIFYSLLFDDEKDPGKKDAYQNLSLKESQTTISLKSNYRDGYLLYGQLLKKYGQKEQARQVFGSILKLFDANDKETKKELESL